MTELVTSFIIGVLLIAMASILFRLKLKWLTRFLLNSLIGGLLLVFVNLFGIVSLAINPLNALICGFLGVFGIVALWALTLL